MTDEKHRVFNQAKKFIPKSNIICLKYTQPHGKHYWKLIEDIFLSIKI